MYQDRCNYDPAPVVRMGCIAKVSRPSLLYSQNNSSHLFLETTGHVYWDQLHRGTQK